MALGAAGPRPCATLRRTTWPPRWIFSQARAKPPRFDVPVGPFGRACAIQAPVTDPIDSGSLATLARANGWPL